MGPWSAVMGEEQPGNRDQRRCTAAFAAALLLSAIPGSVSEARNRGTTPLSWSIPCPLDDCGRPLRITFESSQALPFDAQASGFPMGGLSGIDAREKGEIVAISDDRSEKGPARLIRFRSQIDRTGMFQLAPIGVIVLRDGEGLNFPAQTIDPESVRFAGNDSIFVSSEGIFDSRIDPAVIQFRADGTFLRELELPNDFRFFAQSGAGSRKNLSLEGLATLPPDRLITISESSLVQDGPIASSTQGSRNRIVEFDTRSGRLVGQYLYQTDPVERRPNAQGDLAERGVSEIVGLRDRQILVLEREVYPGQRFEAALYLAELPAPSEEIPTLRKTKIFDFREAGLQPDNLEGMAVIQGRSGRTYLLVCSDNNFSEKQKNQFLLFRIEFPAVGLAQQ